MTSESEGDHGRTQHAVGSTPTGVFVAESDAERRDAFDVRRTVFVEEQGVDKEIEYDDHDESGQTTHFVAYDGADAIGAARLRPVAGPLDRIPDAAEGSIGKVERVAVVEEKRGDGWGTRLMDAVESNARDAGFDRLALHAQTHVRDFYERLGYEVHGDEFIEADIPHVAMDKEL